MHFDLTDGALAFNRITQFHSRKYFSNLFEKFYLRNDIIRTRRGGVFRIKRNRELIYKTIALSNRSESPILVGGKSFGAYTLWTMGELLDVINGIVILCDMEFPFSHDNLIPYFNTSTPIINFFQTTGHLHGRPVSSVGPCWNFELSGLDHWDIPFSLFMFDMLKGIVDDLRYGRDFSSPFHHCHVDHVREIDSVHFVDISGIKALHRNDQWMVARPKRRVCPLSEIWDGKKTKIK